MRPKFGSALLAGVIAIALMTSSAATAQTPARTGPHVAASSPAAASLDVAITYNGTLAGMISSSRFWMQGGGAQIEGRFYRGWGVVADIAGAHVASMNSSGVGLGLVTATFGPRYTWSRRRYRFYAQGLAGEAWGFNSVFPNPRGAETSAGSLAVLAGGGLDVALTPHLALRALEADYLRTQLPNSTDNAQNNLRLAAGLVLRLR